MAEETLRQLDSLLAELSHDDWVTELEFYPHRLYGKGKFYWPHEADDYEQIAVITTVFRDFLSDQLILSVCFRYKMVSEPPSWCIYQELGDWDYFSVEEVEQSAGAERLEKIGESALNHFRDRIGARYPEAFE